MLYRTTFSPSALKFEEKTYVLFIGLLQELNKNCVIFSDLAGKLEKEIVATIQNSPPKYQYKARHLYQSLKQKKRIIKQSFNTPEALLGNSCDFYGLAINSINELLIFTGENCCLESIIEPKSRMVKLDEYLLSTRFTERKDNHIFSDGQINKQELENLILIPLFENAKSVKLIDRYIGRSMINKKGKIEREIVGRYQQSLTWLIELFDKCNLQSQRRFEIYTGVETSDLNSDEIKYLYNNLMKFVTTIQGKCPKLDFDLKVKRETKKYAEMPHGRYLLTDQTSILVERGFDLLWDEDKMYFANLNPHNNVSKIRDVAITRIPDPGKIESSIKKLEDLRKSFD